MDNHLSEEQVKQLLRPVHPNRVFETQGMSNMAAYEIKAHLNRVFGFANWSADVVSMEMIYETPTMTKGYNGQPGRPAYNVAYRAGMKLIINSPEGYELATYTEYAVGDATMPDFKRGDAHDMAIKTAESQALKRCAINLGDQFGLSLYAKGAQMKALVRGVLVGLPAPEVVEEHEKVADDIDPDHPEELPERDVNQEPQAPILVPVRTGVPMDRDGNYVEDANAARQAEVAMTPDQLRTLTLKNFNAKIDSLAAPDREIFIRRWKLLRLPKLAELDQAGYDKAHAMFNDLQKEIDDRATNPTGGDYAEPPEGYQA